jgi:hypothetical protein
VKFAIVAALVTLALSGLALSGLVYAEDNGAAGKTRTGDVQICLEDGRLARLNETFAFSVGAVEGRVIALPTNGDLPSPNAVIVEIGNTGKSWSMTIPNDQFTDCIRPYLQSGHSARFYYFVPRYNSILQIYQVKPLPSEE